MFWRGTTTNMLLITDEADNHTNQDVPTYQPKIHRGKCKWKLLNKKYI